MVFNVFTVYMLVYGQTENVALVNHTLKSELVNKINNPSRNMGVMKDIKRVVFPFSPFALHILSLAQKRKICVFPILSPLFQNESRASLRYSDQESNGNVVCGHLLHTCSQMFSPHG